MSLIFHLLPPRQAEQALDPDQSAHNIAPSSTMSSMPASLAASCMVAFSMITGSALTSMRRIKHSPSGTERRAPFRPWPLPVFLQNIQKIGLKVGPPDKLFILLGKSIKF